MIEWKRERIEKLKESYPKPCDRCKQLKGFAQYDWVPSFGVSTMKKQTCRACLNKNRYSRDELIRMQESAKRDVDNLTRLINEYVE
jgi:hypothetical protein